MGVHPRGPGLPRERAVERGFLEEMGILLPKEFDLSKTALENPRGWIRGGAPEEKTGREKEKSQASLR